jgi:hypothetical protein
MECEPCPSAPKSNQWIYVTVGIILIIVVLIMAGIYVFIQKNPSVCPVVATPKAETPPGAAAPPTPPSSTPLDGSVPSETLKTDDPLTAQIVEEYEMD